VLTQAGEVRVSRVYRRCVKCDNGGFALDERLESKAATAHRLSD